MVVAMLGAICTESPVVSARRALGMSSVIATLSPRKLKVIGDFAVRGGTAGIVTVDYSAS